MNHVVILAGGIGERFWPVSRKDHPKQFVKFDGKRSLLRATFERVRAISGSDRVWIVTAKSQASRVRRELPEIPKHHVLAEPQGRNTAPAVYWAALAAMREDDDATLAVVPADAWVPSAKEYQRTLRLALRTAARKDVLVLLGVKPTRAETGYGYILPGESLSRGVRKVKRFEEKPNQAKARRFFKSGAYLWNCGIFAWRAATLDRAVKEHLPGMARAFKPLSLGRQGPKTLEGVYARTPSISVDYGILEPAHNVAVVPSTFAWDDLGSWAALARLGKEGSFARGDIVSVDSDQNIVWSEGGVVAVLGVSGVIVVHTPDATLVVSKDRAQDVRTLVNELAKSKMGKKHLVQPKRK